MFLFNNFNFVCRFAGVKNRCNEGGVWEVCNWEKIGVKEFM